ncbi:MAG: amidohydrolase family protein [Kiritimatiellia bacterium]
MKTMLITDFKSQEFQTNKMSIIDFHTHAFADALAPRAIAKLSQSANARAYHDGTLTGLLSSMDHAGIDCSLILSIATRPEQFEPILRWSEQIRSKRILPLASVHPDDPQALAHIRQVAEAGLPGIKLHPYYQNFRLDEGRMLPLYEVIQDCGLLLICHTGFDQAFPRDRRAEPKRIMRVLDQLPKLKFVATHLGAWCDWEEMRRHMLGRPIWMDLAFALEFMDATTSRALLMEHPAEYLLFGTDSPWADQTEAVGQLRRLGLARELEDMILGGNAARLLNIH